MVETISAQPPKFTTIMYETKDGEKISATKKDGIVTLVGDKNGVRQIELEKFLKEELPNNVKNLKLENSPEKDTVELSKTAPDNEVKETTPAVETKNTAAVTNPITTEIKQEEKTPEVEPKKLDVVA